MTQPRVYVDLNIGPAVSHIDKRLQSSHLIHFYTVGFHVTLLISACTDLPGN